MMDNVGLSPSDTGAPGGKRTGQHVSHYIKPGADFDTACRELAGFEAQWNELFTLDGKRK